MTFTSANFYASGAFNSQDQVPAMLDGAGQPAAPISGVGIEPWESVPICIMCVDITFFENGQYVNYSFAGNGYSPDIMRWWDKPNPIPAGQGFPFPANTGNVNGPWSSTNPPPHIDLHVNGATGQPFQAFYTVYYTK